MTDLATHIVLTMPAPRMHTCRVCKQIKPIGEFYAKQIYYCKICQNAKTQARQARLKANRKKGFDKLSDEDKEFIKKSIAEGRPKSEILIKIKISRPTYSQWIKRYASQLAA